MSVILKRRGTATCPPPVGTTWLFEYADSGSDFIVPADGNYQIEMHGGGGGCARSGYQVTSTGVSISVYATGGGSGKTYTAFLAKGDTIPVEIGSGGESATGKTAGTGGTTTFGDASIDGGSGGYAQGTSYTAGSASGSIATAGKTGTTSSAGSYSLSGGYGNSSNTSQIYGNGGGVVSGSVQNGQPGAVIITYLGKE